MPLYQRTFYRYDERIASTTMMKCCFLVQWCS